MNKRSLLLIIGGLLLLTAGILANEVESSGNQAATAQMVWQHNMTPTPHDDHDMDQHDDEHMEDETTEEFTAEMVEEGRLLFTQKGCIACHGENAQGTNLGPNLAGHTPESVRRQVRIPTSNMPVFLPTLLSNEEVTNIAAYIASLEMGEEMDMEHAHETNTIPTLLVEHHVLARDAMLAEDYEDVVHQIDHIIEVTSPPHQSIMQLLLEQMEDEDYEEILQTLEDMLEGVEVIEEHDSNAHLRLALAWVISQDQENALHHLAHASEDLDDDEEAIDAINAIIEAIEAEEWHAAEEALVDLLPPVDDEEHDDMEHMDDEDHEEDEHDGMNMDH
ncbi:MAG: cytochrome c [Chloroflexi bacterium]|nr:cytochrome c [Chloroflexota bacterium]